MRHINYSDEGKQRNYSCHSTTNKVVTFTERGVHVSVCPFVLGHLPCIAWIDAKLAVAENSSWGQSITSRVHRLSIALVFNSIISLEGRGLKSPERLLGYGQW